MKKQTIKLVLEQLESRQMLSVAPGMAVLVDHGYVTKDNAGEQYRTLTDGQGGVYLQAFHQVADPNAEGWKLWSSRNAAGQAGWVIQPVMQEVVDSTVLVSNDKPVQDVGIATKMDGSNTINVYQAPPGTPAVDALDAVFASYVLTNDGLKKT